MRAISLAVGFCCLVAPLSAFATDPNRCCLEVGNGGCAKHESLVSYEDCCKKGGIYHYEATATGEKKIELCDPTSVTDADTITEEDIQTTLKTLDLLKEQTSTGKVCCKCTTSSASEYVSTQSYCMLIPYFQIQYKKCTQVSSHHCGF
jgi:hypothetical protein